jgi:hypothetical protein
MKFIISVLKIGIPLSLWGIVLFMGSVHSGFNPVFYVIAPAVYLEMKYLIKPELTTLLFVYCIVQFIYYALIVFLWQKWQSRKTKPSE